jgi:hypothetical protein
MTKTTYKNAKKKKEVRKFLIDKFTFNKVIGLAGPDINEYIDYFKDKNITVYENNMSVLGHQLSTLKKPVNLKFGNILSSSANQTNDTLFDLDYCATIPTLEEHIKEFRNKFIMTFSLRGIKLDKCFELFFKYRKEHILKITETHHPVKHKVFITNKGTYISSSYRDTSPMLSIAKIK